MDALTAGRAGSESLRTDGRTGTLIARVAQRLVIVSIRCGFN